MAKRKYRYRNRFDIGGIKPIQGVSISDQVEIPTLGVDIPNSIILPNATSLPTISSGSTRGLSFGTNSGMANAGVTLANKLMNPRGNSTKVGNVLSTIGSAASAIPGVGGLIGTGVNLVGGLFNTMFGSNINEEAVAQVESNITNQKNMGIGASTTSDFLNMADDYRNLAHIETSDIGSDGWFSNKASNKTKELNWGIDAANRRALANFTNTANNVNTSTINNLLANYTAYGGPITMRYTGLMSPFGNQFKDGGGIHIKKKNRGKFTEYCGGKVTSECIARGKRSSNPTIRKRATFAANSRKWHHADGGWLDEVNNNPSWSNAGALGILGAVPLVGKALKIGSKIAKGEKSMEAGTKNYLSTRLPSALKDGHDIQQYEENKKSEGGPLFTHGGIWSNGMTYIDNGGTHEENPFEGVQLGVDSQGIPNLVEEGEVVWNDYVFSNRLKVPEEAKKKLKLKGTTFADAAKEINKESEERPNDPISKNGLESSMSQLMMVQEDMRAKKQRNKYAKGGRLYPDGGRLTPYSNFTPLTDDSFYTPEYMNFWNWYKANQNASEGRTWLDRINSGEFGTIGGNTFTPKDVIRLSHDYKRGPVHNAFALAASNKENPSEESYTPYTKRWIKEKGADGVWRTQQISDEDWNATPAGRTYLMRNPNLRKGNTVTSKRGDKDIYYDVIPEEVPKESIDGISEVAGIGQNPLRYAPIIGSGITFLNDIFGGNKPDYTNADLFANAISRANKQIGYRPIGNYLTYRPFDRDYYINKHNAQSGATRRALMNSSGANRAAAAANLLAADYNAQGRIGDLARQAEEYNQSLRERVEEFNRQTNMFNSEQGTKVDMFNTELLGRQAGLYGQLANMRQRVLEGNRAEKSANLTNFIQGLGDLGREITDRDTLRWLADIGALPYNTRGQYTGGNTTAAPKRSKGGKIRKGFTV